MRIIGIALFCCCLFSCKKDEQRAKVEQIVKEWTGKEIRLPEEIPCKVMDLDTVYPELASYPYKVLVYIDSLGCTDCKLRLPEWKRIIYESDTIAPGQIAFLFYFHPKSEKELTYLLKRDQFDYPVFFDIGNKIDKLNHFHQDMMYQSLLLNKENQVLLIGNPAMSSKIWDLYKQLVTKNRINEK
jgi:hypothetical protein